MTKDLRRRPRTNHRIASSPQDVCALSCSTQPVPDELARAQAGKHGRRSRIADGARRGPAAAICRMGPLRASSLRRITGSSAGRSTAFLDSDDEVLLLFAPPGSAKST